jgi:uncharacterized phage protein gp47/JayE
MPEISPDYAAYTDLTLYDKTPSDIKDAALVTLQSRMPDFVPGEANIEIMLLEALAIEVSQSIFTLNRLPQSIMEALMVLFGIERDPGIRPTVTVTFTMQDTAGYVIPAGTELHYIAENESVITFTTATDLTVTGGSLTGTVSATADVYSSSINGVLAGADLSLVSAIDEVIATVTASTVTGGIDPETITAWLTRATQRLQRLTDVLVLPDNFKTYVLEKTYVTRANAIDSYDPGGGGSPGDNGGHIAVYAYGNGIALTSPQKAELVAEMQALATTNLIVHVEDAVIVPVTVTVSVVKKANAVSLDVQAAVEAALTSYLSPTTWDWSATVRRNALIAEIANAEGVAYVTTLTLPATDLTIGTEGKVLASPGTFTVTVA